MCHICGLSHLDKRPSVLTSLLWCLAIYTSIDVDIVPFEQHFDDFLMPIFRSEEWWCSARHSVTCIEIDDNLPHDYPHGLVMRTRNTVAEANTALPTQLVICAFHPTMQPLSPPMEALNEHGWEGGGTTRRASLTVCYQGERPRGNGGTEACVKHQIDENWYLSSPSVDRKQSVSTKAVAVRGGAKETKKVSHLKARCRRSNRCWRKRMRW